MPAALDSGCSPWEIRIQGALQAIGNLLLAAVATHTVGHRPERYTPRVQKRRPKRYKLVREPRQNYRRRKGRPLSAC